MGILTNSGQTLSDDELKSFFSTNPNADQIAQAASQYGLNQGQVTSAMDTAGYGGANHEDRAQAVNNYYTPQQPPPPQSAPQQPQSGGINIGGQNYSAQQVKDFYANGGNDVQFAQEHGMTADPWARRDAILQARQIGGNSPTGEAAIQQQFQRYQQYNPGGAAVGNYQAFKNGLGPDALASIQAGTFTGSQSFTNDYQPGGIYGPGSAGYGKPGYASGLGPRGDGGSWSNSAAGGVSRPGILGGAVTPIGSAGGIGGATGVNGSGSGANGSGSGSNGITPWNVTPEQTVEGRIGAILRGNPLVQQARTGALERMNERGMLNSSLATTAADAATYQAAIPIAANDAATYAKAAGYNADTPNQFATNAMNRQSQLDQARLQSDTSRYGTDVSSRTQLGTSQISANTQLAQAQMSADTQRYINQMDNTQRAQALQIQTSNQTLLQTNSQAAQAFNTGMNAINTIQQNAGMDGNAKTQAMANVWHDVQSQLKVLGATSGLNLSTQLNFANYQGFDAQGNWVGFPPGMPNTAAVTGSPALVAPPPKGILSRTGAADDYNLGVF